MRDPTETTRFANSSSPLCSRDIDKVSDLAVATKLLISIRNTEEAAIVRDAGVDWIDLKEPQAGALGRPSFSVARAVAELLEDHPHRSVALGELNELDEQMAFEFAKLFPVLKVGLSRLLTGDDGNECTRPSWQTRFDSLAIQIRSLGSELIPVAYADWSVCGAPSLDDVLQVARRVGASYMLIDTFVKDGRGLLDWLSLGELSQVIEAAREFNCGIVLAGSLKITDVLELQKLCAAALAVRGAVCSQADSSTSSEKPIQSRTTPIDPNKVAAWRSLLT